MASAASTTPFASIAVQPPTKTRTDAKLYPPVVVKAKYPSGYLSAIAELVDSEGHVLDDQLGGKLNNEKGWEMHDAGGISTFFAFPDLVVHYEGEYTIRVKIVYTSTQGGVVLGEAITGSIKARGNETGRQKPCKYIPVRYE